MGSVLNQVEELVAAAARNRDSQYYIEALRNLNDAIGKLESALKDPAISQDYRNRIAEKLADCYGMKGGVLRRDNRLPDALEAYKTGAEIEQNSDYGIVNTYCLVNSLVVELLLKPDARRDLLGRLATAREIAWVQAEGPRRKQWWAWADAGLMSLLASAAPEAGIESAMDAYREFAQSAAGARAYDTTIDVLQELRDSLRRGEPALAEALSTVVDYLQRQVRSALPRLTCFVAMPFGVKKDSSGNQINFDALYVEAICPAIEKAQLEPIRADEDPKVGGMIHHAMLKRLRLSDFIVADLSTHNPNVFYELGIRHGAGKRATILLWGHPTEKPPFDVSPYLYIRYTTDEAGREKLRHELSNALDRARRARYEPSWSDNPLIQLFFEDEQRPTTGFLAHEKADLFRKLVDYDEAIKRDLDDARNRNDTDGAKQAIKAIEERLDFKETEPGVLVDLMLSYRHIKAWNQMIELIERLPPDLRSSRLVREQHAFALNRRAMGNDRNEALAILETLNQQHKSSETLALTGRIYKDLYEEWQAENKTRAAGYLRRAIENYAQGFEADPRDAYPGINALTLLEVRGQPEALEQRDALLPVVKFAVRRRLGSDADYWDYATLLEIAVIEGHFEEAWQYLEDALARPWESFAPDSTARNLELIAHAREQRGIEVSEIRKLIEELRSNANR